MIVYFADRELNILGQASTGLPGGIIVEDDNKTAEVETGVAVFECSIPFTDENRAKVEAFTEVGNYILRSEDNENEFYTIIDAEINTKTQTVDIYAEDAGLDLLNDIVGAYEAAEAYSIDHYVNRFANDSGFQIGVNEAAGLKKKLSWDGDATAAERIASVAAQFDGCEVSYSFAIKGLAITAKYINIYKERGKDIGAQLRLNKEIDRIITKKSIANVATALRCTGGTPDHTTALLEAQSDAGSPRVLYSVSMETRSRTASAVNLVASVTASLNSATATIEKDYVLTASIYVGGKWYSGTIKAADDKWKGTTKHTTDLSFTVSGIPAGEKTFTDIRFSVARSDSKGGSVGVMSAKNCSKYVVTNYISDGNAGDNGENISSRPMTLEGYTYDDGDFYLADDVLKSRKALAKWRRFGLGNSTNKGHIVRTFSYDTLSQAELCAEAVKELKLRSEMEVNYEVDFTKLPDYIRLGDRVNIIDDAGELYVSARVLKLTASATRQEKKATIGEFIIKGSGISQKVAELAAQFAKMTVSAARALAIANAAKASAMEAQTHAGSAISDAAKAEEAANAAQSAADVATQSAANAQTAANNAQSAVDAVGKSVSSLETTVTNAQQVADNAHTAATTAQTKAGEAATAAAKAVADAADAKAASETAQGAAETAITKANEATETAEAAKTEANSAKATADAAKIDAQKANEDIVALGEGLETVSQTMQADYARKTDLTEATASLQTQITQNAAQIESTASRVQTIDETANNAQEQAAAAQTVADEAAAKANQATADAVAAQTAANNAAAAATAAQAEADTAKTAATTAKSVADKAEEDLAAAKADLATVTSRVGATESEIAAAQAAVTTAQAAADKAKADAATATKKAEDAQETADTAVTNASTAQAAANAAASKADLAQQAADAAKGDASAAQARAEEAAAAAATAQETANTAKTNAANAQAKANQAATDAANAQKAADDADARAAQAETDLATAQQNLAAVTSRVGATEAEVEAAQAAVATAQAAADKAKQDAATAQSTADTAKANAATAKTAADNAKTAADNAQAEAEAAQEAADEAQAAVDALAVRVTTAETKITQNSEQIALRATKTEVSETLGGYYTKTETDAAITVKANEITQNVSKTYATVTALNTTNSNVTAAANAASNAQSTADTAKTNAATAQSTANTAKTNAATAQTTANNAATAAANAKTAADNAQAAADSAQDDVDALAVRVTTAETSITQNAEAIELRATKTELSTVSTAAANAQSTANTALSQTAEFIVGTHTAVTGSWTGKSSTITALYDGLQIAYWLPYKGSGSATLNLTLPDGTTTGAIKCYYQGTTRINTHYPAGTTIRLTYRSNATISGGTTKYTGWWADGSYDSNTYDRTRYANAVKALEALAKSTPLVTVGTASGYKIAKSGVAFDVSYPVLLHYNSSAAISANGTTTYMYSAYPSVTLRNNVASWSGTQYAMVYLVGTLVGKTFTINSTVFTTSTPTSANGLAYIPIGVLYSTYQIYFRSDPTVYAYGDNGFAPVAVNAQTTANTAKSNAATAQAAADEANNGVAALEVRVTSAETSITQNADAIALRATKTELSTVSTAANNAQSTADTAKKIANAGAKKINTHLRNFTKANWQTYGAVDHSESWTTGTSYDNTHINVGDIAYIVGKVSDAGGSNDVYATIYGKVTSVTTSAVVMTSQYYIMGGEGGAYALANSVKNDLAGNYYTKTQTDSQISVESDAIKAEVAETYTSKTEMVEQKTTIYSDTEKIILSALETYAETSDLEALKSSISAQLQVMRNEISMNFTSATGQTEAVNNELQSFMSTFSKYIKFTSETAITIGSGDSAITLEIDNETGIAFKKNGVRFGWWDGEDFHTGNIVVEVDERAQFGNFAFLPLSDGSLIFSKVGG